MDEKQACMQESPPPPSPLGTTLQEQVIISMQCNNSYYFHMITLFDVSHGVRRKRRGGVPRLAGTQYSQCAGAASAGAVHWSAGGSSELRSVRTWWAIACASRPPNRAGGSSCASASLLFSTSIPLCASQTHPFPLHHSSIAIISASAPTLFPNNFFPTFPPPSFLPSLPFVCIALHRIAELSMCTIMVRGLGTQWWERGGSCCLCCASGQQYRSLWAGVGPIWSKRGGEGGGRLSGTWFAACCRGYPEVCASMKFRIGMIHHQSWRRKINNNNDNNNNIRARWCPLCDDVPRFGTTTITITTVISTNATTTTLWQ